MIEVRSLGAGTDLALLESTRALFREYGDFLRLSGSHPHFRFDRFEQEILDLPWPYTNSGGDVFAAVHGGAAAGCIAYREFPGTGDPFCCEIKRLFVAPVFRGAGLGKRMISSVLESACTKGFRRARLDTDPASMPAAHRIYREAGFIEYEQRDSEAGAALVYLEKSLLSRKSSSP